MPPDVPEVPLVPEESVPPDVPDVPLALPGQKQEAASVPDAPEVVAPDVPEVPDVVASDAPLAPDVPEVVVSDVPLVPDDPEVVASDAPLVEEPLVPEVPLDSEPPAGVSGIRVPCEPSGQVQLVLELLPEVPAAPLPPEVVAGSVEEPDVAAPLAESDGDVLPMPDPLVVGSLLPGVALLPDVPLVVPYVLVPEVAGSVVDAPLVPSANAMPPAPSMETKIAIGNFLVFI